MEARNVTDYNNKHGMSDESNLPAKKVTPKKYSFIHNQIANKSKLNHAHL